MDSYELAYRMQMKVPGILDLGQEKETTREAYGLNDDRTKEFGRRLLLARRLLERGVRFVQAYTAGWDSRLPRQIPRRTHSRRRPPHRCVIKRSQATRHARGHTRRVVR